MAIELKVTFLSYGIYDNWMESYFNIGGHMSIEWKALSWGTWQLNGKLLYCLRGHMAIEWIVTLLWWGTNDNCMQSTLVGYIWPLSGPFLLLSFGIYDNWVESYYTVVGETYDNWMGSLLLSRGTYDTDTNTHTVACRRWAADDPGMDPISVSEISIQWNESRERRLYQVCCAFSWGRDNQLQPLLAVRNMLGKLNVQLFAVTFWTDHDGTTSQNLHGRRSGFSN